MFTRFHFILAVAATLAPLPGFAQDAATPAPAAAQETAAPATAIDVQVSLDPPVTPYHRPAKLTISATVPASQPFTFPELPTDIEQLTVTPGDPVHLELPDGQTRVSKSWTLDPIAPKEHAFTGLVATSGDTTIALPPLLLVARELTEAELAAIENISANTLPTEVLEPGMHPLVIAALIAGALAAIAAGIYVFLRRSKDDMEELARPPWEVALVRLSELDSRHLPEQGRFGPYYVDLSAILRYYIEDRFYLRAPEQTTQEFLEAAAKSGQLSEQQQEVLAALLRHSDRVKFARYEPSVDEMQRSFNAVRWFIEETTPHLETQPTKEAA